MIVATVFVVLLPVAYFLPSAIEAFSTLLLILLVGSGGILGGVAFHKVFQDKRLPLLQVLPISRSAAWAMLVSANAAATVPSYFLIVLLAATSDTAWPAGVLLMIYFEAFCCGCCAVGGYTPEFGGRFFVDLAMEFPPGIIVSGALAAPWILGLYLGTPTETYPLVVGLHVVEFFEFVDMRFLVGGSLVCALGALGVAHDYFQFGESALQSTQWRNAWRAAIVSAGFVVLAVATAASGLRIGEESMVWALDSQLKELEQSTTEPSARLVVDDVVYEDSESVVSRLRDMLPVPPEAAGERVGMYLTSIWPATILFRPFDWFFPFGQAFESGPAGTSSITYATEDLPPFYVISDPRTATADVYALDPDQREWQPIVADMPLDLGGQRYIAKGDIEDPLRFALALIAPDQDLGVLAYALEGPDDFELFVFDRNGMKSTFLGRVPNRDGPDQLRLDRLDGFDGLVVSLPHRPDLGENTRPAARFAYHRATGIVTEIPEGPNLLLYLDDSGTLIYRNYETGDVFRQFGGQSPSTIWP